MTRARRGLVALVLALVAGCGDDGALLGDAPPGDGATTTAGAPGPGETASTGEGPGPGATEPGPVGPPATGGPPASEPPAGWPELDGGGRVGSFAPALLRADLSGQVVIEVHAADGAEPRAATLDHLETTMADVSGKPVAVSGAASPDPAARDWSPAELAAAADAGARTAQGDGVAVIRLLFVHGTLEGDDGVLGVAIRGDVAAVFIDSVEEAGGLLGGSAGIEVAVTTHELGHLLGLVDLHLDTGREDPEHPGHSRNEQSVMYWAVESDLVGQVLGADPPRTFDDDDRADLAAIRSGG